MWRLLSNWYLYDFLEWTMLLLQLHATGHPTECIRCQASHSFRYASTSRPQATPLIRTARPSNRRCRATRPSSVPARRRTPRHQKTRARAPTCTALTCSSAAPRSRTPGKCRSRRWPGRLRRLLCPVGGIGEHPCPLLCGAVRSVLTDMVMMMM